MKKKFVSDYFRMTGEKYQFGFRSTVNLLMYHHIRFMWWYRRYQKKPSFLKKLILFRYAHKYGLEISLQATIDEGVYLGHPYNITVGGGVSIGKNVNLHKGCTIGRENRGKREGVPVIGDNVYVGINSTVVGAIKIGNDVMIAPNTFVNFDVPDYSVVIGNPATIHLKDNATGGYVGFRV